MLKDGLSTVANVILPLVSCFTSRFLPAIISTVLPALMDSPVSVTLLPVFLVPPLALAFNVKAALFTALTTESTVAILPLSTSLTFTVPFALPVSTGLTDPVLTFKPLLSLVSVLSPAFTLTPAPVTSKEVSAAFTSNFTFAPFAVVTVSPDFTSFCFSTVTVVPLPLTKFT